MHRESSVWSEGDEVDWSEPREDLPGLLEHLQEMTDQGTRFSEVTYIVNTWSLGGVIPLWHHGFVVRGDDGNFLTLDFSRRGILWDTFDTYPDLPENTVFVKKYAIDTDPATMKCYCEETKPFSWHSNDCQHWARGVMRVMCITEDPLEDRGAFRKIESPAFAPVCFGEALCCGSKSPQLGVLPRCMR